MSKPIFCCYFIILISFAHGLLSPDDQLLSVVVVFRHGDRTPVDPYPNDPYKNRSYWPTGFGQLTNTGKLQHLELGRWFRQRYDSFLPDIYSEDDIYVRSTDADRTLMSAEANLAGLYPPQKAQVWDPDLPWQPIPVHTVPKYEDSLLAMEKPCPRFEKLLKELFASKYFQDIAHKNHDLYAYLSRYSGEKITSLETLEYLYNTFYIETLYNYTLPEWARNVYPAKMKQWAELSFATDCFTPDLARLKTGVFFDDITHHFLNKSANSAGPKFKIFSGHDITISNVLNTMGAFEYHCPPYASSIIFELRRNNRTDYVNLFYKNSSEVQNISLKGCKLDCPIGDFVRILQPITISQKQWNWECRLGITDYIPKMGLIFLGTILASIVMSVLCIKLFGKNRSSRSEAYTRLPNYETVY